MRHSNGLAEPIGNYLSTVAAPALAAPQCRAWRLTKTWEKVVGPSLAVHTEPSKLSRGVLTIRVDSPVWMHQLTFLRLELLEKLAVLWPDESIIEIQLRRAPLQREESKEKRPVSSRLRANQDEIRQAETLAAVIPDERLRRAVVRFLENQMARNRENRPL